MNGTNWALSIVVCVGCATPVASPPVRRPSQPVPAALACPPAEPLADDAFVEVAAGSVSHGCVAARRAPCLGQRLEGFAIQREPVDLRGFVSWGEAERHCLCGGARLATEAEWERAREEGAIAPREGDPAEWLDGWYTYFGPGFSRTVLPGGSVIGNSRLAIKIFRGDSWRFGGPIEGESTRPPLLFRCVRGPRPHVPDVRCRRIGEAAVDCGR